LKAKLSQEIAGVYFETPSYLGSLEDRGQQISDSVHEVGGLSLVGVDPISLGVLAPPSHYGADIACGDIQSLGIHMQYGGGHAGFIATRDEERFVMEYPSRLFGIESTRVEGEYGFGDVTYERTSFADRENAKEFVGTAAALWGITAGVYLALMGPQGMKEIGRTILQKTQYARKKLSDLSGIRLPLPKAHSFRELVVDVAPSGKTVREVNERLLKKRIYGGVDLTSSFSDLGSALLVCVTEIHTKENINELVGAFAEILEAKG
jgi:glycine dehydrogenase subunit 1